MLTIEKNAPVTDSEINLLRQSVGWDVTIGSYDRSLPGALFHVTARVQDELAGFVSIISDGINDAYVIGVHTPLATFTGTCCAIIHRKNDNEDKLVVSPENKTFTIDRIRVLTEFQEKYFEIEIIR